MLFKGSVVVGIVFFSIFMVEHVGRLNHWSVRPSKVMEYVAVRLEEMWRWMGRMVGHIVGVFEFFHKYLDKILDFFYIHFKESIVTLTDLGKLVIRWIESPVRFVYGFKEVIVTYQYWELGVVAFTFVIGLFGVYYLH